MSDHVTIKMEQGQKFTPCPTGLKHAVCADLIALGEVVDQYQNEPAKIVHKVALVFQTDEENPETGKRFEPSIEFTIAAEYEPGVVKQTFGARSKIRKMLGAWRGKEYTDAEASAHEIPLNKLVGVNASINVLHKTSKKDRQYAVIDSIAPPMKGMPKIVVSGYERSEHWAKRKDEYAIGVAAFRAAQAASVKAADAAKGFEDFPEALDPTDDDLPF